MFDGNCDTYGYGRMYVGDKEVKAHRVFYEQRQGPIPEGMILQHHLAKTECVGHARVAVAGSRQTNSSYTTDFRLAG
jgi:hypothetical protein